MAGVVLAFVLGLVAYSASPFLVAVVVALMLAPILFIAPVANIWAILVAGLLITGLLPMWADGAASKASWAVSGLGFVLLLRAFASGALTAPTDRRTPGFVVLALIWMAYCITHSVIQYGAFYDLVSGVKRYFQVWGLVFALAWLPLNGRQIGAWLKFMLVVALLQLPWAIYQRVSLVPVREGLKYFYPGMVPADVVAGTFGAPRLSGGANAEMATFLLIVVVFLIARWRAGLLRAGRLWLLLVPCLLPLFLGETKIVVVFAPMLMLLLFRRELIRRPVVAVAWLAGGAVLTLAAAMTYFTLQNKSIDQQIYETNQYNFKNAGYGNLYLNRTTALSFWFKRHRLDEPVALVLGHGIGTAHDETGGAVAAQYRGYGIGLTAMSTMLWEHGVLGVTLFLAVLVSAWRAAGQLLDDASAQVRADALAIQATIPVFMVYLIYRSTQIDLLTFQLVFLGALGYLAWMLRHRAAAVVPA